MDTRGQGQRPQVHAVSQLDCYIIFRGGFVLRNIVLVVYMKANLYGGEIGIAG